MERLRIEATGQVVDGELQTLAVAEGDVERFGAAWRLFEHFFQRFAVLNGAAAAPAVTQMELFIRHPAVVEAHAEVAEELQESGPVQVPVHDGRGQMIPACSLWALGIDYFFHGAHAIRANMSLIDSRRTYVSFSRAFVLLVQRLAGKISLSE